jgi:hypothetical protein
MSAEEAAVVAFLRLRLGQLAEQAAQVLSGLECWLLPLEF